MSFVLDASVTMRWSFGDGSAPVLAYASRVLEALRDQPAVVPTVWGLEVANVLSRAETKGLTTEARSGAFLAMLERLDITVDGVSAAQALSGTLQLARRYDLSAYDASYLELAIREALPLASLDKAWSRQRGALG